MNSYTLSPPSDAARRLASGWLFLAVGSLVLGGLLSLLIAASRTPGLQEIFPLIDYFHAAITVHVDLTVLVWFLAFAGVFWSFNSSQRAVSLGKAALCIATAGTLIFTFAPLFREGEPLMNNYFPVIEEPVYLAGLAIVGLGFGIMVVYGLLFSRPMGETTAEEGVMRFGLFTALIIAAISLISLVWSYLAIPDQPGGRSYYEILFWGGGHVLQFTHTQLLMVAWLWLASASGLSIPFKPRLLIILLILGFVPVLAAPAIYLLHEVGSAEHVLLFGLMMKYGHGAVALLIGGVLLWQCLTGDPAPEETVPQRRALLYSIILFGVGGGIGYLINSSNVTIPAHYHGSIVAVTIAFMGITYQLLPKLGFAPVLSKSARVQPVVLGIGQLLHVGGLAWSGGYGIARKTAGAAQGLEAFGAKAAMGIMGLGAGVAAIGGIIFMVVVIVALKRRENQTPAL